MNPMNAWPAPAPTGSWPASPAKAPPRRWFGHAPWVIALIAVAFLVMLAAMGVGSTKDKAGGGGSFYAQAGWTVDRAADLSVKIDSDDGASRAVADCAMKAIVGSRTWLEWQSLGSYGQLAAIRDAERGC